jgi:hypothetical protein
VFGGTSAAAPIVAAAYAVAGAPATGTYPASYPYANPAALFDVTSGSNGSCTTYLCKGAVGFDGPTGLGTPKGTNAFLSNGTPPPPPPVNLAPVIDSQSKSCTANKCTFTVNAHDPEGATLTYKWSNSTSTTNTSTKKYGSTGSKTITATVGDGVNSVKTTFSISCKQTYSGIVCS